MRNKLFSLALILIMVMTFSFSVSAQETGDASAQPDTGSAGINNASESVTSGQAQVIFNDIKQRILFKYGEIYSFDNFSFELRNERIEDGRTLVDADVYADMTLTRHPSDSPFIKGMSASLSGIGNKAEKALVKSRIDGYVAEIEKLYYNKPDYSVFSYSIAFNNDASRSSGQDSTQYELFYRTDVTAEEIVLEPAGDLKKAEDYTSAEESGVRAAAEIQSNISGPSLMAAGFYDRLAARDYALNNATAAPEFSGSGNSDCANFVSKSLNSGGIPEDSSGNWYRASAYGNVGTCGTNWMRTGYNNNGGVVPYMTGKSYFYKESTVSKVFAGSIMYWTNTSHVALVTYGDTVTIKYTQHSNYQLTSSEATKVYQSESAYFYMPSASIMK